VTTLIIGLLLFLGVHSVSIVAPAWRDRRAASLGVATWQGIYAVIALIGLVLIVRGYGEARMAPVLIYTSPQWLKDVAVGLMIFAFPLLLAAYLPGRIKAAMRNNPMLVATKVWATAHLLANGALADVVLFGSVLAWAAADRVSLKFRTPRPVRGLGLYLAFIAGVHAWLIGVPAYLRWP
jgi:uncharacterized membrane protein